MRITAVLMWVLASAGFRAAADEPPADWVEPVSGRRVLRISREPGTTALYFHQNACTADGDKMVVARPGGLGVVDLRDLPAREITPLVDGPAGNVVVGRKTRQAFYLRDGAVRAAHLDTRADREIVRLPPALRRCTGFALNADETLLAGSYAEGKPGADGPDPLPDDLPPAEGGKRRSLEEKWAARLPMRLFTVHVGTGEVKTFHPSPDWLNHVQFSPTDPAQLLFSHEGPWHLVDRIWTIRTDGSGLTKVHARTMEMEIAGHEFFGPDGRTVWFDLQTPKRKVYWLGGRVLTTGESIRYPLDPEQWSTHYNVSPDGRLFAGDGGRKGPWIYLFTPKDGKLEAEKLVDLSKHDYTLEPNVRFTPDGKWIVFIGNFQGAPHTYAVEVTRSP